METGQDFVAMEPDGEGRHMPLSGAGAGELLM